MVTTMTPQNQMLVQVTYTAVSIDHNDHKTLTPIIKGQFRELNAAYCDKNGRYFRVFETPDRTKFIFTELPYAPPGQIIPMLLIPIQNPNSESSSCRQNLSTGTEIIGDFNNNNAFVPSPTSGHDLQRQTLVNRSHEEISQGPEAQMPLKILGMRKFLLNAITKYEQSVMNPISLSDAEEDEVDIPHANVNYLIKSSLNYPEFEIDEVEQELPVETRTRQSESPIQVDNRQNCGNKISPELFSLNKDKQVEKIEETKSRITNYLNVTSKILPVSRKVSNMLDTVLTPPLTTVAKRILKPSKVENLEALTNNILRTCLRVRSANVEAAAIVTKEQQPLEMDKENQNSPYQTQEKNVCITEPEQLSNAVTLALMNQITKIKPRQNGTDIGTMESQGEEKIDRASEEKPVTQITQEVTQTHIESDRKDEEEQLTLTTEILVDTNKDKETDEQKMFMSETGESMTSEDFYSTYLDESNSFPSKAPSEKFTPIPPKILSALEEYKEKYERDKSLGRFFPHRSTQDLTKLVLQRVADDPLMEIIGKNLTHLKYLDVSGSPLFTNEGIKHLFVKSAKENSSLYLMSSWIHKNINVMNKVVFTLDYFDYSYTGANFYSRRLVNLLPGAYVFQRIFRAGENDSFGHHVFSRRPPDFTLMTKGADKNNDFEIQLRLAVGHRGGTNFCKFLQEHPGWKNCFMVVKDEDKFNKIPVKFKQPIVGIVTASKDDKRIYGQVTFETGQLSSLYSLFPVDMGAVGECCPTLKTLSALIVNTWQKKSHFLPNLTKIDAIAEPATILSIFQSCPTLKFIKFRVKDGTLCDHDVVKNVKNFLCCRNIKEVSIIPGFFRPSQVNKTCSSPCRKQSGLNSTFGIKRGRSGIINPPKTSTINEMNLVDNFELTPDDMEMPEHSCKLSVNAVKAFLWSCPNLVRLGNLAFWAVSKTEFDVLTTQLCKGGDSPHIVLEWDSIRLPQLDIS